MCRGIQGHGKIELKDILFGAKKLKFLRTFLNDILHELFEDLPCYLAVRKNEVVIHTMIWINLVYIKLSEIR